MAAHAGLESNGRPGGTESRRLPRAPAMQAYCASLSRFTSSVHSAELTLRHEDTASKDDAEQLESSVTTRLHGIEKARAEAESGLEHTATVRDEHGVGNAEDSADDTPAVLRRRASGDLGVALTSLARRRDELRAAEAEFEVWLNERDEQARRVVLGAATAAGVIGTVVMAVAGSFGAGWSLPLLVACIATITVAGIAAGLRVRLPLMCTGPSLVREPDAAAVTRFGAALAGVAAVGLGVVSFASGAM